MRGLWLKMPLVRGLSPTLRGFAEGTAVSIGFALALWPALHVLAVEPSADLFRSLAEINAALLIAYAIEVSWIARAARRGPAEERDERLGLFVALGASGLIAILLALATAERTAVHHWIWRDEVAFGWIAASLLMFGFMVVLQPLVFHEWADEFDHPAASDPDKST